MDSYLSQGYLWYVKCNQSRPGFELVSPCLYPTTITITLIYSQIESFRTHLLWILYIYIIYLYIYIYIYIYREREREIVLHGTNTKVVKNLHKMGRLTTLPSKCIPFSLLLYKGFTPALPIWHGALFAFFSEQVVFLNL